MTITIKSIKLYDSKLQPHYKSSGKKQTFKKPKLSIKDEHNTLETKCTKLEGTPNPTALSATVDKLAKVQIAANDNNHFRNRQSFIKTQSLKPQTSDILSQFNQLKEKEKILFNRQREENTPASTNLTLEEQRRLNGTSIEEEKYHLNLIQNIKNNLLGNNLNKKPLNMFSQALAMYQFEAMNKANPERAFSLEAERQSLMQKYIQNMHDSDLYNFSKLQQSAPQPKSNQPLNAAQNKSSSSHLAPNKCINFNEKEKIFYDRNVNESMYSQDNHKSSVNIELENSNDHSGRYQNQISDFSFKKESRIDLDIQSSNTYDSAGLHQPEFDQNYNSKNYKVMFNSKSHIIDQQNTEHSLEYIPHNSHSHENNGYSSHENSYRKTQFNTSNIKTQIPTNSYNPTQYSQNMNHNTHSNYENQKNTNLNFDIKSNSVDNGTNFQSYTAYPTNHTSSVKVVNFNCENQKNGYSGPDLKKFNRVENYSHSKSKSSIGPVNDSDVEEGELVEDYGETNINKIESSSAFSNRDNGNSTDMELSD
ncbi:hypothetical protein BB561_001557 [Smittium simulii]|uniref:Uncharacterized protein n=1 Tax=Smittium simulii TaxID=133385 RepID=A0A2T9YU50_9FUNG|nr:hypothetical protein BB561_001557 [Smittium simulii]